MNKLRGLTILMCLAIVAISAFQVYWLLQNYDREKKSLGLKTDLIFRESIMELRVAKMKLDDISWSDSSGNKDVKIFVNDGDASIKIKKNKKADIASTLTVITNKLNDSTKRFPKRKMIISMDNTTIDRQGDTASFERELVGPAPNNRNQIFNLLYGVDSLQDSLRVKEVDSVFAIGLKSNGITIPYTISKTESVKNGFDHKLNEVTVGLVNPVTYKLQKGNTFPFLIRQIAQPILFSVLLLAITILSFVLLYKSLLKQRILSALKNEFISNITHELKTPIATVGVALEALKNFNAIDNPERTKEYLDISTNELHRLSLLVDKVLKLSMFEKKEMELKLESLDLKHLADEVIASLKLQLENRNAQVTLNTSGNLNLLGDRHHLLSVIFNLLDNAMKYSPYDPVIELNITETEHAVELKVKDNGIGVAPEYRDKIFDKFFRIPHGNTHNAKGYGLGLSYVAQVIHQHNGTISVASQPGEGTVFTINLPKNVS